MIEIRRECDPRFEGAQAAFGVVAVARGGS
jgi:hypothetical protein